MLFENRIKTHHIGRDMMKYMTGKKKLIEALDEKGKKNQVIYIHIPYCSNICSFCNMNRSLNKPHVEYANLIIKQIKLYAGTRKFKESTFDSIYFGGGTPSVLSETDLVGILNELSKYAKFTENIEISMETSLTDMGIEKFRSVNKAGVNRLSLGIQTFSNRGRRILGRRGDEKFAVTELKKLRATGFANINIDLIYNYFDQTTDELDNDLKTIDELDLAGFSFYSLIIMDKSRLGKNIDKYNFDDSVEKDFERYSYIVEKMKDYNFLELTKLVKPNRDEYKYIRRRLEGKDTFPIGAGAGGQIGDIMIMNPIDINQYMNDIENFESLEGMRFCEEYFNIKKSLDTLQRLYYDPALLNNDKINNYMEHLVEKGYAYKRGKNFYLNKKGAFWGNNITSELWKMI